MSSESVTVTLPKNQNGMGNLVEIKLVITQGKASALLDALNDDSESALCNDLFAMIRNADKGVINHWPKVAADLVLTPETKVKLIVDHNDVDSRTRAYNFCRCLFLTSGDDDISTPELIAAKMQLPINTVYDCVRDAWNAGYIEIPEES